MPTIQEEWDKAKPLTSTQSLQAEWDSATPISKETEPAHMPYLRQVPRTVGGILGGIAGAPLGPLGVVGGIAAGAAGGEALEQIRERIFEPKAAALTTLEAARRASMAGLEEPAYQLAGGVVAKGIGKALAPFARKALAPFARKVSAEAEQAISFLKDKIKPVLTPAEATRSRGLDILENIAEGSLLGGGKISAFKIKRQEVLNNIVDDIVDQFGKKVSPDELGETFLKIVEGRWQSYKELVTKPLYNTVEELVAPKIIKVPYKIALPGTLQGKPSQIITKIIDKEIPGPAISTKSLKTFAKPLAKISEDLGSIEAKNAGDDLVMAILDLPDSIEFKVAKELRSRLISRVDEFSIINKKAPAIGKANQFIKLIDGATEKGLSDYPEALSLWREANELYKQGEKQFNNAFIRKLIKKADPDLGGEPEAVGKIVFTPGAINHVKRIKEAVGPNTFKQFQSYYLQTLISKSVDDSGNIIGNKMFQNMYGKGGTGENVLRELFDPQTLRYITDFANAAKIAGEKTAEGTGKIFIQLKQAGAVAEIVGGTVAATGRPATGMTILLGPMVLSNALMNPQINHLLTLGYKLPPGSPEMGGLISRITGAIYRAESERRKQLEKEEKKVW